MESKRSEEESVSALKPDRVASSFQKKIRNILANSCLPLVAITLAGALLRLYHLGFKALWFDEAMIYWIVKGRTFSEIIPLNAAYNSAPPLFTVLTALVVQLSETEFALRFIPWLAGVASIPVVYFLARQFTGKIPAYVSAGLVALAPTQVRYSQELREYSLAFLLAALMILFFTRYLRENKIKDLIPMTVLMVIAVFTQYGLALLIIALNIIFLIQLFSEKNRVNKKIQRWLIAQLIVAAAVVVVYATALRQQFTIGWGAAADSSYLSPYYGSGGFLSLLDFAISRSAGLFDFAYPRPVFLLLALLGLIIAAAKRKHFTPLMLFVLPTALTLALALAKLYPYGGIRQVIFLTPMIYILAGLGINRLLEFDRSGLVIALVLFFPIVNGLYHSSQVVARIGDENIRPIVTTLDKSYQPGEMIYVYYGATPAFSYYYRENKSAQVIGTRNRGDMDRYLAEIEAVLTEGKPTWLVFSHCYADECQLIPEYISNKYRVDLKEKSPGTFLYFVH